MVYSSQAFAALCARTLENLQAQHLVILDLRAIDSSPTDYFLICSANSDVHARALADTLVRTVDTAGFERPRTEGRDAAEWILLDFFDVIVHIFRQESRDYYKLEKLWGDAPAVTISDLQPEKKKAKKTTTREPKIKTPVHKTTTKRAGQPSKAESEKTAPRKNVEPKPKKASVKKAQSTEIKKPVKRISAKTSEAKPQVASAKSAVQKSEQKAATKKSRAPKQ